MLRNLGMLAVSALCMATPARGQDVPACRQVMVDYRALMKRVNDAAPGCEAALVSDHAEGATGLKCYGNKAVSSANRAEFMLDLKEAAERSGSDEVKGCRDLLLIDEARQKQAEVDEAERRKASLASAMADALKRGSLSPIEPGR